MFFSKGGEEDGDKLNEGPFEILGDDEVNTLGVLLRLLLFEDEEDKVFVGDMLLYFVENPGGAIATQATIKLSRLSSF